MASGPIVRTGATPKFWQNWDQIFGDKKGSKKTATAAKPETASRKKAVAASSSKPAAKNPAKKKSKP